jgi:glutathione S-transferase
MPGGSDSRVNTRESPIIARPLSLDAGDLKTAEFRALNPRRGVPVLVEDDFALAESAAIVEYIEDRWPSGPALFARDPRRRAIQRRMMREADDYLADLGQRRAKARMTCETTCAGSWPYGRTQRPAST